jgi:hypothetical protein
MKIGQEVYVPCNRFPELENHTHALYKTKIQSSEGKSYIVDLPGGVIKPVGKAFVRENVDILILTIGDLETEEALMKPLSESIFEFCKLLIPHDQIRSIFCRTIDELNEITRRVCDSFEYIIITAHGDKNGIYFMDGDSELGDEFFDSFKKHITTPKQFIGLACQTGRHDFAFPFSNSSFCKTFIGPYHSVHGAIASLFTQAYLTLHLLEGHTEKVAFKKASALMPSNNIFRLWIKGVMEGSKSLKKKNKINKAYI